MVEAADGQEALRKVAESRPDLLVLDVMMPGMDGFQVLERLQMVPGTMQIPVVFLTAKAADSDRIQGLSLGAHDYVSKPFNLNELSLRINRLLETKERIDRLVDYGQRDEVTGLPRRSYFETSIKGMIRRHGPRLGMIFIIFEGLDDVTTEAGLSALDEAMASAAEVLQRYAGEECEPFWIGPAHAAMLQGPTDSERLSRLEKSVRKDLEETLSKERGYEQITVTTASGLYDPDESAEDFVERVTGMAGIQRLEDCSANSSEDALDRTRSLQSHPSNGKSTDTKDSTGTAKVIPFPGNRRTGAKRRGR